MGYKTGSGNVMPLKVRGELMDRSDVPIVPEDQLRSMCTWQVGCKGHNGGCPPYSPYFENVKPSKPLFYAIVVEFDMKYSMEYSRWWRGKYNADWRVKGSNPGSYILTYADRLTMCYVQRILKVFERQDVYCLGLSNCPGCRPADCTVTQGMPCRKPKKRRYSVEAVGILCSHLHLELFGEHMTWWHMEQRGDMPVKMVRYAGLLLKEEQVVLTDALFKDAVLSDKSYTKYEDVPELEGYDISTAFVPEGCLDTCDKYDIYKIPVRAAG